MGATETIETAVWAEAYEYFRRIVDMQREQAMWFNVQLVSSHHGNGGPEIVLDADTLSPLALMRLVDLVNRSETGFSVELWDSKIHIASSSWQPDRIPF